MKNERPHDPTTPAEWQEAVDLAHFWSLVQSAIVYGLVTGPEVKIDRCDDILTRGAALGVHPSPGCVERIIAEMHSASGTEAS